MVEKTNHHGFVASLQLCPGQRKPMQKVAHVRAIANLGLEGDRHAIADSSRQVLLIEKETLDQLNLAPGQVKENIATLNIELMKLSPQAEIADWGGSYP